MAPPSKTNTPSYKVLIAGETFTQKEAKGMISFSMEEHIEMIGVAQITFRRKPTEGQGETDWTKFEVGADVEITVAGESRKMFKGFITGLRHSWQQGIQSLTVIAMDPLVKAAASRVTKVYEEQKDSDVASAVIGAAGLSSGTVDSTAETHKYIFQRNESNYNFLKRLASRNGYLVLANEGKIDFKKAQFSGSSVPVAYDELVALDYTMNPVNVPPELTTIGWDYITKQKVEGTASSGDIETIGGGANIVGDNGGIWAESSYISDVLVTSQAGAKEMAKGELNRLARGFIRGRCVLRGRGDIYAGVKLKFEKLVPGFNPEVFVVACRHIVEPGAPSMRTEVNFCGNTKTT